MVRTDAKPLCPRCNSRANVVTLAVGFRCAFCNIRFHRQEKIGQTKLNFQMGNGVFTQPQEELTEEVNLRLFDKPKHNKINKEMAEFVEGLK